MLAVSPSRLFKVATRWVAPAAAVVLVCSLSLGGGGNPGGGSDGDFAHNGQPPATQIPLDFYPKFAHYYQAYLSYSAAVDTPMGFGSFLLDQGVRRRLEYGWHLRLYSMVTKNKFKQQEG